MSTTQTQMTTTQLHEDNKTMYKYAVTQRQEYSIACIQHEGNSHNMESKAVSIAAADKILNQPASEIAEI